MEAVKFTKLIKNGSINIVEFIYKVLNEAKELNNKYNLFITISESSAIEQAEVLEKKLKAGKKIGKLAGIPISVKDNICTKGIRSTAGSRILESYIPPFDATVVKKIKEEDGIIIGKTSMDEFGFGSFSCNCGYKIPKNPINPEHSCGGSSGGAGGITFATKYPHIALAESTGGSISCPAAFTSTVGLTPTYGLVSRYGLIDYASSLDKIGIISKNVRDCALLLSVIAGYDSKDSTSLEVPKQDYLSIDLESIGKKITIGVPKEYLKEIDSKITDIIWKTIKKLESEGIPYEFCDLKLTKYAVQVYYIIAMCEASTNIAKYCGLRYGMSSEFKANFNMYFSNVRTTYFGKEAKRRIMLGTFARMSGFRDAYYLKAMKIRRKIINEFKKLFKQYTVLIAPTMPILPPSFERIAQLTPLENYLCDILTIPPNLAGIPMISVPCGFIKNLPVGLHIIGNYLDEITLLRLANYIEKLGKN